MSDTALRPLDGVRVLDLTRLPPGAYCTSLLSDLGADVCQVVPSLSATSFLSVANTRSKRSIALDLRHPRGLEVLARLASWADVLVENERPGAMDERGFGPTHAAQHTPALIWCSISGFGQDGPYATRAGHDLSYVAHSGLLTAINPALPWHPQTILSIPTGALMAVVGILAALRTRDRTGVGCQLDISLSEAATWVLSGTDGEINGNPWGVPIGPDRRLYECADGAWVAVASAEPRTWDALCRGLGLDDLVGTVHRWPDQSAVTERVAAVFATAPAARWVEELSAQGATVTAVNRGTDLRNDPHVNARGTLQAVGDVLVPRNPIRVRDAHGEQAVPPSTPPVPPGADTDAVLADAGFGADEIAALRADGVIAKP